MMNPDDLTLSLAFDGSITDAGPYALHEAGSAEVPALTTTGGTFRPGRQGEALFFPGEGHIEVVPPVVPLWQDFTLTCFLRALPQVGVGAQKAYLLLRFEDADGAEQWAYYDLYTTLARWTFLALVQQETTLSVYVNNRLLHRDPYPQGWGKPVGWVVANDAEGLTGHCAIDELNVYWEAQPIQSIANPSMRNPILYSINGTPFTGYGVYVSASNGLLDNLSLKEPLTANWDDAHGEFVDLSAPRYQPRDIVLSCFITAASRGEFIERLQTFLDAFQRPGLQRLMVDVNDGETAPLVYEVYLRDSIGLEKKWRDGKMAGTFELRLREPEPVKRVLLWNGAGEVSITLTTSDIINVYWGDGQSDSNVYGTRTITHTYPQSGEYYIIITGVLENITAFNSNAQVVWNKL